MRVTREIRPRRAAEGRGEKDGRDDERRASEKGCARCARGWLPRRMSLGVCPPGRGERAVTERDGVTKEGTRRRWNGTYTFSSLPRRCFAGRGGVQTRCPWKRAGALRRRSSALRHARRSTRAFSLSSLSHPLAPIHAPLLSLALYLSSALPPSLPSIHPSVCLRLHHFSSDPVTIPPWPPSLRNTH